MQSFPSVSKMVLFLNALGINPRWQAYWISTYLDQSIVPTSTKQELSQ